MKRTISTILILVGLLLISTPYINKKIVENNSIKKVELMEKVTKEEIQENSKREAEYDFSQIKDVEITTTILGTAKFENESIIGQILIPELNINLPILKGVTHSNLLAGASTMVPDLEMGKKNYSLASHYMKDESLLFGSLIHIKPGTTVLITDKNRIYEYKIYDTMLVPETAMEMLDHEKAEERGKPIISLMTCYYTSKNGKRFFALGELVDEYDYDYEILTKSLDDTNLLK